MAQIIAVGNQKGGVGKTTTVFNLAACLAKQGLKVLAVDNDPQGSLTYCLNHDTDSSPTMCELYHAQMSGNQSLDFNSAIRTSNIGVDYIPANILLSSAEIFLVTAICREYMLKRILERFKQSYDYILIDCGPSLGVLLTNALSAADSVIIPLETEDIALEGLLLFMQTLDAIKQGANPTLLLKGILLTKCYQSNISKEVERTMRERFGEMVFTSTISRSVDVSKSTNSKRSLLEISRKLGSQYMQAATELIERNQNNE